MKKTFLKIAFIAIFGLFAGYNMTLSKNETHLTDLMLKNVEALADTEIGIYYTCRWSDSWERCRHRLVNPICLLVEPSHCNWL